MMKKITLVRALVTGCALGTAFLTAPVSAQSVYTWNVDSNGNWNLNTNWSPSTGFPNGVGITANITNDITGNRQVSVNAPITVGIVNIGDSNGSNTFTLQSSGGNSLTFDNTDSTDAQLNKVAAQTTTVSVPLILNDRLVVTNNQTAIGNLNGLLLTGAISGSGGITFSTDQPSGAAVSGTGAGSFTSSNLVLNAATSYAGSTILAKGDLTINSGGTTAGFGLQGTSELVFRGGNVVLRNGSTGTDNNRINDAANFRVQSDGVFVYRTANAAYTASESVAKLILETGTFQYRVMNEAPAGFSATFTFSDLERVGATNFSFANFGSGNTVLGSTTTLGTNRLFFTNINGSAATDTAFLGGWATYGSYANFAAYSTTNGLSAAAQSALSASSNDSATNFFYNSGTALTLNAGAKSVNSLALGGGASNVSVNINGTVTLVSGGLTFGNNPTGTVVSHQLTNGSIQVGNTVGADTLFISVGAQSSTNATISAVIQNNGSDVLTVAKGGTGEVIFNNAMTYTGATYVEGGKLTLGASGSLANGNVTIRNNANFSMLSGSSIQFNILNDTTADQLIQEAGGLFSLNGTLVLNFSNALIGSWDLFNLSSGSVSGFTTVTLAGSYSGSLTNSGGVWTGVAAGADVTLSESTGVLTVVPEPSTWALLIVSLAGVLFLRRRRSVMGA
jgi:autotransporter-associated beta strand protein